MRFKTLIKKIIKLTLSKSCFHFWQQDGRLMINWLPVPFSHPFKNIINIDLKGSEKGKKWKLRKEGGLVICLKHRLWLTIGKAEWPALTELLASCTSSWFCLALLPYFCLSSALKSISFYLSTSDIAIKKFLLDFSLMRWLRISVLEAETWTALSMWRSWSK